MKYKTQKEEVMVVKDLLMQCLTDDIIKAVWKKDMKM